MTSRLAGVAMIAIRVRRERERQGLSQNALAKRAGISTTVLNQLESGESKEPRFSTVQALAQVLGVSIDWLCGRSRSKDLDT